MRVDTKEWYVFPEGSDANTRVLSLPGIDPDSDPIDIVCADGRRRGLWKIQDENLVLKTLKREGIEWVVYIYFSVTQWFTSTAVDVV